MEKFEIKVKLVLLQGTNDVGYYEKHLSNVFPSIQRHSFPSFNFLRTMKDVQYHIEIKLKLVPKLNFVNLS